MLGVGFCCARQCEVRRCAPLVLAALGGLRCSPLVLPRDDGDQFLVLLLSGKCGEIALYAVDRYESDAADATGLSQRNRFDFAAAEQFV